MDVHAYLARIGYDGPRAPTPEALSALHRAHLHAVPFEHLALPLGTPIELSPPALFDKVVTRRRGGFCYELNGLFGWLLGELGFAVELLSARVFDGETFGPEFDHMLLWVEAGGPWIADVGFGDSFLEPPPLGPDVQTQRGVDYRLVRNSSAWTLQQRKPGAAWEPQYVFTLQPHSLADFEGMCHYHQTSSDSPFLRKSVCSRATPDGRVTLSNGRLIVTTDGQREERGVADGAAYRALLRQHFGVELKSDVPIERLIHPATSAKAQ